MSSLTVIVCGLLFIVGVGQGSGLSVDRAMASSGEQTEDGLQQQAALGLARFSGLAARTTSYYMTHACERTSLLLTCPQLPHRHVMYVSRATYGRHMRHQCLPPIMTPDALNICLGSTRRPTEKVSAECNGKESCQIDIVNRNFGDPCPRVFKYLEVYYYCVPLPY